MDAESIAGYELTEEQKEQLAAVADRLKEAFSQIAERLAEAFRPICDALGRLAQEFARMGLDEWQLKKMQESNNHRRMHGKPMIRRRAIIRARKRRRK